MIQLESPKKKNQNPMVLKTPFMEMMREENKFHDTLANEHLAEHIDTERTFINTIYGDDTVKDTTASHQHVEDTGSARYETLPTELNTYSQTSHSYGDSAKPDDTEHTFINTIYGDDTLKDTTQHTEDTGSARYETIPTELKNDLYSRTSHSKLPPSPLPQTNDANPDYASLETVIKSDTAPHQEQGTVESPPL